MFDCAHVYWNWKLYDFPISNFHILLCTYVDLDFDYSLLTGSRLPVSLQYK